MILFAFHFIAIIQEWYDEKLEEPEWLNELGKVYQLLAHGGWFTPGTPASSTTKTGPHDIAEILLKVALKHQKSKIKSRSNQKLEKGCS